MLQICCTILSLCKPLVLLRENKGQVKSWNPSSATPSSFLPKPPQKEKKKSSAKTKPFKHRNFAKTTEGDSREQEALVPRVYQTSALDQASEELPTARENKLDERRGMVYALHPLFVRPKPQTGNVSLKKFCNNVCFSHVRGEFWGSLWQTLWYTETRQRRKRPSKDTADDGHIPSAHTFQSSSALWRHVGSPVVLIYMSHCSDECYCCSQKHMLRSLLWH